MSLGGDCLDAVRIPDNQISIRAHCNTALPRVQVKDFSCVCAGHSDKLVLIHLASHLGKDKRSHCISQVGTTLKSKELTAQQIPNHLRRSKNLKRKDHNKRLGGDINTLLQVFRL